MTIHMNLILIARNNYPSIFLIVIQEHVRGQPEVLKPHHCIAGAFHRIFQKKIVAGINISSFLEKVYNLPKTP